MNPPICKVKNCGRECGKMYHAGFMLGYMKTCPKHDPDMMRLRLQKGLPI